MDKDLMRLVNELKRRRVFVSLIVTMTKVQITWWDGHEMRTGDADSVRLWLKGSEENDRREIEYVGRRLGWAR